MGQGFAELAVLVEECGRAVAPVPTVPTLVGAALPIARFGSPEQRERWLPRVAKMATESCLIRTSPVASPLS